MTKKIMKSKTKCSLVLILYSVLLYAIWTVNTLVIEPYIGSTLGKETFLTSILTDGLIKNLVWTVPAALLVWHFRENCMVSLREMFVQRKKDWLNWMPVLLFFVVYVIIGAWRTQGGLHIQESFGIDDIITVLFVGLTEEMVFRGWLLNATCKPDVPIEKQWLAIALNALFFLSIHFPTWIVQGILISTFTQLGFVSILALSVVFSVSFLRTKNLLIPIALHMAWDLLLFMFM